MQYSMTAWQSETGKEWQIGRVEWASDSNPVMIGVVSSFQTGDNFIFWWNFLKPIDVNFVQKCQTCVVKENLESLTQMQYSESNVSSS